MFTACITEGHFALGEYTHALRPTSKLADLRAGYAKWIRRAEARRAASQKLRTYDARCASYVRRVIEAVITRRS